MNVLLLGWSRIAARRVLPALRALGRASHLDVASRRPDAVRAALGPEQGGKIFEDYAQALAHSRAELVYVSTVNAEHAPWAERAIESGRHVVVDKPACLDLASAARLVALSERRGVALAEATVYAHHPQLSLLVAEFPPPGPARISAVFTFPALDPADFRNRAAAGGGALYDLGAYAVSPGRILFGSRAEEIVCRVTSRAHGVDAGFSVFALHPGARSFVGHFGFGAPYVNRLEALGPAAHVTLERAFSPPPDTPMAVQVKRLGGEETLRSAPGDAFFFFLQAVLDAIERGDVAGWRSALLLDAEAVQRLRESAGVA